MENTICNSAETHISLQSLRGKIDILILNLDFISYGKGSKSSCMKLIKEITNRKISMIKNLELVKKFLLDYYSTCDELKRHQCLIEERVKQLNDILETVDHTERDSVLTNNNASPEITDNVAFSHFSPDVQMPVGYKVKVRPKYLTFEIPYLSDEDFKTIPKYMVGRLTVESINNFVEVVNESLSKKYNLLSKPLNMVKSNELQFYRQFKHQQSGDLKAKRFVTEEDIAREFNKGHLEKRALNFLTILRHTRRLSRSVLVGKPIYVIN